jgi:transcriptional regulator with XRE-family HTH domain
MGLTRIAETANQLGVGIRTLRKERRWKQTVLAEATGLSVPTISLIETSKTNPSYYDLEKIAHALETSVSGLLAAGRKSMRDSDDALTNMVAFNIRKRREFLGLSRSELAQAIGLLPQYLSTTENAKRLPGLKNFLLMADGLSIAPHVLLSEDAGDEIFGLTTANSIKPGEVVRHMKAVRSNSGLSRRDVSLKTGLDAIHLSKLEEGRHLPNLKTIVAFCRGMNFSLDEMFLAD